MDTALKGALKEVLFSMTFVAMVLLLVNAVTPQPAQADESGNRVVRLQAGSVSTEVCVLVVHRSRMHSHKPIARCLTKEELARMLK